MIALLEPLTMGIGEDRRSLSESKFSINNLTEKQKEQFRLIDEIDLTRPKIMLCRPVEKSGEGWTKERTERCEELYKKFLKLHILYPEVRYVPNEDIDQMWHWHVLDTARYREDCQRIFGHYLNHYFFTGSETREQKERLASSSLRTQQLFKEVWGLDGVGAKDGVGNKDLEGCCSCDRPDERGCCSGDK